MLAAAAEASTGIILGADDDEEDFALAIHFFTKLSTSGLAVRE